MNKNSLKPVTIKNLGNQTISSISAVGPGTLELRNNKATMFQINLQDGQDVLYDDEFFGVTGIYIKNLSIQTTVKCMRVRGTIDIFIQL